MLYKFFVNVIHVVNVSEIGQGLLWWWPRWGNVMEYLSSIPLRNGRQGRHHARLRPSACDGMLGPPINNCCGEASRSMCDIGLYVNKAWSHWSVSQMSKTAICLHDTTYVAHLLRYGRVGHMAHASQMSRTAIRLHSTIHMAHLLQWTWPSPRERALG